MNERKPDRVGQVFAALGKSVCYVGLFMGMQVVVVMTMLFSGIMELLEDTLMVDDGALNDFINGMMSDGGTMVMSLISGLLTLIVVLVFYLIRRKKLSEAIWLRPVPGPELFAGAALAPGLYLVVVMVVAALPESWTNNYDEASAGLDSGGLAGVLAVAVMAPIVEEVIFRGLVLNRLSRVMPGWLAVLISAAVFGACHGEFVWFCYTFILGVVFALVDLHCKSILPSILGHLVFNAIGQFLSLLPEEGDWVMAMVGVLFVVGIAAPLMNRRAIAAAFRPAPKEEAPVAEPQEMKRPRNYDYDPWDL